jgi:hypothetical protein
MGSAVHRQLRTATRDDLAISGPCLTERALMFFPACFALISVISLELTAVRPLRHTVGNDRYLRIADRSDDRRRETAAWMRQNIRRTIWHGQPGLPCPLSVRGRQNRLPSLLAVRLLSSRSVGREIRAGDQPSGPYPSRFIRLPLARRGAVKEGQVGLWRLPTGSWTATAAGRAARDSETAVGKESLMLPNVATKLMAFPSPMRPPDNLRARLLSSRPPERSRGEYSGR